MNRMVFKSRTRAPREWEIYSFDIEDNGRGELCGVVLYDPVQRIARDFRTFKAFRAEITRRKYREAAFIGHNAEYDIGGLWGIKGLSEFSRYVQVRGHFKSARLPIGGGKSIHFFDLHNHIPVSLEKIGRDLGLPKGEDPGRDRPWRERLPYCVRDCEITARAAMGLQSEYLRLGTSFRSTVGASAMELFQRRFLSIEWASIHPSLLAFMRGGYYGGRTEAFRVGTIEGPVYAFDVNALYPACMRDVTLPDPGRLEWVSFPPPSVLDFEGMSEVEIDVPDQPFPILPYRLRGKLCFPVGRWRGTYPHNVLRYAIRSGHAKILKIRASLFSRYSGPFLREYVEALHAEKLKAKGFQRTVIKGLSNNLYGKFGTSHGAEIFKDGVFKETNLPPPVYTCPVWCAYVTSEGWIKMDPFLDDSVLYTDTDSLHTLKPIRKDSIDSDKLGYFKAEGIFSFEHIVGPKMYYLENADGSRIYKAKGFPKKAAAPAVEVGMAFYRAPVRLREAIRRGLPLNRWRTIRKLVNARVPKRRILEGGVTIPLVIYESGILSGSYMDTRNRISRDRDIVPVSAGNVALCLGNDGRENGKKSLETLGASL